MLIPICPFSTAAFATLRLGQSAGPGAERLTRSGPVKKFETGHLDVLLTLASTDLCWKNSPDNMLVAISADQFYGAKSRPE